MAKASKVDWYGDTVKLFVENVGVDGLTGIALRVEERAKANIVANNQVDTGAMLNGIYTHSPTIDNYASGGNPLALPRLELPDELSALVAGAMSYTIYQEMANPFLYPALEATASEVDGILKTVAKKHE